NAITLHLRCRFAFLPPYMAIPGAATRSAALPNPGVRQVDAQNLRLSVRHRLGLQARPVQKLYIITRGDEILIRLHTWRPFRFSSPLMAKHRAPAARPTPPGLVVQCPSAQNRLFSPLQRPGFRRHHCPRMYLTTDGDEISTRLHTWRPFRFSSPPM